MSTHNLPDTLEACHQLIDQLNEENSQLRQTASVFGQLAERLNHELRVERSLYSNASLLQDADAPQKWGHSP
jgi:hypothetical protein